MQIVSKKRKISFVIACYHSQNSLQFVVEELTRVLHRDAQEYEVILVNDGSTDNTFQVIQELCHSNSNVKGINLARNFGQQNAMLAGFNFTSGELVFYCDDDGQSPVKEYKRFIQKLDEGFDMVWAKYPNQRRSLINGLGAKINNKMLHLIFKKPLELNFGNMWVAKSFIINEAVKCKNPRLYLGGVFLTITSNMANVECYQRERLIGRSNYSLVKLVVLWLNGLTAFSIVPLRAASVAGGVIAFSGGIYMAYLIFIKLTNDEVLLGYSSIMSVILFIGGMLLFMIGVLGEYIGRIYSNMNSLPQFVIKQKINVEREQKQ